MCLKFVLFHGIELTSEILIRKVVIFSLVMLNHPIHLHRIHRTKKCFNPLSPKPDENEISLDMITTCLNI